MLKIGKINSLSIRLLTTSRLSGARGGQRRANVEPTKTSKTKAERTISSNGAPYVTSDLSSDAKVILCHKLLQDMKPTDIAASDLKYGAQ